MRIINAVDYGIRPNTEISEQFYALIRNVSDINEEKTVIFENGVYDFFADNSPTAYLRVTNSCGETEWSAEEVRNQCRVALLIENAKNLTIDGNGSVFRLHGRFTNIAIRNSENIVIKNLVIRPENPNIHEFKVINKGLSFVDYQIDKGSKYIKENGKFYFVGDGYKVDFTDDRKKCLWLGKIDGGLCSNLYVSRRY